MGEAGGEGGGGGVGGGGGNSCLYSSAAERQSCKLKVLGSMPSGGFAAVSVDKNCSLSCSGVLSLLDYRDCISEIYSGMFDKWLREMTNCM